MEKQFESLAAKMAEAARIAEANKEDPALWTFSWKLGQLGMRHVLKFGSEVEHAVYLAATGTLSKRRINQGPGRPTPTKEEPKKRKG